jgi:hypothetical protein
MENRLIYNAVKCLVCEEVLTSYHRHDYKICSCENETMVDGGLDYARFGGKDFNFVEPLHIYDDAPHETIRKFLKRGGRGVNGDQPLTYVDLKDIDTDWLEAIITYEEENRPNNIYLKHYKTELEWRSK